MNELRTKAYIYVRDDYQVSYVVSTIEQILYEDDRFTYIFTPHYPVIELLSSEFFQGIPGINLELKKESYIRENEVPTFIYERVPQQNREDLWEMLSEVGLDYYNPLEYLIRSDKIYTGDKLFVGTYYNPGHKNTLNNLHPFDTFELNAIQDIGHTNFKILKNLITIISSGSTLKAKDFVIDDSNRKQNYELFYQLYTSELDLRKRKQREGIDASKHKYRGRKKQLISFPKLVEVMSEYERNEMNLNEAMEKLAIKSSATFYRRLKDYRESNSTAKKELRNNH